MKYSHRAYFAAIIATALLWNSQALAQIPATPATPDETAATPVNAALAQKLGTPQATVRTFVAAAEDKDISLALDCFDLTDQVRKTLDRLSRTRKLYEVVEEVCNGQYSDIPNTPEGKRFVLADAFGNLDGAKEDVAKQIVLLRGEDKLWRFSSETVDAVNDLYATIDTPETDPSDLTISMWLELQIPKNLQTTTFLLPDWQWLYLGILVFVGFLADLITRAILHNTTHAWFRFAKGESETKPEWKLWRPVGRLVQAILWYFGIQLISLPLAALAILGVILKIFVAVTAVWSAFRLIDVLTSYIASKAVGTATKFDDLLVPLISRSLKVMAVCIGLLSAADALSLPMAGLIGGLSIGGIALAMASQDAVSNLFGSVTVLVDRPFEIGDWIVTDSVEGTVETVGFRSTRVRTFYNSLITVPNSRLTTAIVDNMGRRRFRRIRATLGLQYDTTPEQIDAFCEGVRELIRRHPYTRKDYYHVYLNAFSASSVDIMLYAFVECPDWSVELREKHRLYIDIMRLAQKLGVQFAFPTQTLHMVQDETGAVPTVPNLEDPQRAGQHVAAAIAGPALSAGDRPGGVAFPGPAQLGPGELGEIDSSDE